MRPRLTYANVMATLAVFIALGGTAYAVNTVGSSDVIDESLLSQDIKNGEVKVADVGQGAVASPEVKNDSILAADVAPDSLTSARVADNSLKGVDIDESTLTNIGGGGPAGGDLTGAYPDPEIAARTIGASELEVIEFVDASTSVPPGGGVGTATAACPDDMLLISGGAFFAFPSGELSASFASRFGFGGGWNAQGQNNGNVEQLLTARAFCLREGS